MPNAHLRPPQQRRSRRTLQRILDAAAQLLETRSFEELTVAEVVAEAGCSVGAFYGRLGSKEALLDALDERYFGELRSALDAFLDSETVRSGSLHEVLDRLAGTLFELHDRQRGLLRALILHARVHRAPAFESREEALWAQVPRVTAKLMRFRNQLAHANPEQVIVLALLQMLYSLRELTLWPRIARHVPARGPALARELARAALAYLTTKIPRHDLVRRR